MGNDGDVLQIVANEDLPKLRDIYKNHHPRAVYIYNYLNSVIKWKKQYQYAHCVTVLVPHGNWRDGTFIAFQQFHCYEVYMFTLEKNCEKLYEALISTKKLEWNKRILIYAVHIDHYRVVLKALSKTEFALEQEIPCSIWWMPMKKALEFKIECPSEVYVQKLRKIDAHILNAHWPHKYPDSEKYLSFIIEINGGYGVFQKCNNALVAWILRIQIGLGTLHVLEEHKRKGYGSLITKILAKELAREGINPVASILDNNSISQAMFMKVGFEKCASVVYFESNEVI